MSYYCGQVPVLDQDLSKPSLDPQQSKQPLWTWDANPTPELPLHPLSCDGAAREGTWGSKQGPYIDLYTYMGFPNQSC